MLLAGAIRSTAQPIGKRVLPSHSHPRQKRICAHSYGSTWLGADDLQGRMRTDSATILRHSIALLPRQHQVRRYTASLQLSTAGLHGICTATKTTRHGQPFACTWHGITGRDFSPSRLLHWLAELASLSAPHSKCKRPAAEPDFLFLNCSLSQEHITEIAPASYARTLLHL